MPAYFNKRTPLIVQPNDWACSVCSTTMALNSVGTIVGWEEVCQQMGQRVTQADGLMDGSGASLVDLLGEYGLGAGHIPRYAGGHGASWDDVVERAGHMPVLLGGQRWNHWTFVRGVGANGNLELGNPAASWKSVGQEMDRAEFDQWGPWSMVWIEVENPEGEDLARIEELQHQVNELQTQVNGLITAVAHLADVIVPGLAQPRVSQKRRAQLAGEAKVIREQFIGPPPG